MKESLKLLDISPDIAQWAARLPGSTITGVKIIESETWGVALDETHRPRFILIGDQSHELIAPERWPAIAAHEAAHSSATFFTPKHEDVPKELAFSIGNIEEDMRNDHAIQRMMPGLVKNYEAITDHWKTNYQNKIQCYKNNRIEISNHKDIIEALLLLKFLGIEKCLEITHYVNQCESIKMRNGTQQELNLKIMWLDLIETTQQNITVDPKFTSSITIRKEQNRTAVKYINEWLDHYSWVFRNTATTLLKYLEGKQEEGAEKYEEAKAEDGKNPSDKNGEGKRYRVIIEKDATLTETPELINPKTPAQQQDKEIQRIKECFKAPGDKAEDASTLSEWASEAEVKKILPEVYIHFPITAPKAKGFTETQISHKREATRYGRLSVKQVTRYISNNRPAEAPLFERWQRNTIPVPPIYPKPPRGDDFPIKRLALYLDLSGSMTAAVGFMVNWTLAMTTFARSQHVIIRVVIGDTGTIEINPESYHSIDQLMANPRGGCGNSPTWQETDMDKTLAWVKGNNDNLGKAIFVTDMAIQENEKEFVKNAVNSQLGILIPEEISIAKIGELLWGAPNKPLTS